MSEVDPFLGYPTAIAAAEAVAAVNAWREYQFEDLLVPGSNGTAVFAIYHSWTLPTPLAGGLYQLSTQALAGGPLVASGTDLEVEFQVTLDGIGPQTPVDGPLVEFGIGGGRFPFSFTLPIAFPPGAHTFDLRFRQPAGPGTAQMSRNTWKIERVG